jgi:hypothetical protein
MSDSTAPVASTSTAEKQEQSAKSLERSKELKAKRAEINSSQDRREADFNRVVENAPKISDFPNSAKVKISRELSNLMTETNRPKKLDNGLDEKAVERNTPQKPQSVETETGSTSDAFFQRLASMQTDDKHTARDSLQGNIKLAQTTRQIDIKG